MIIQLDHDQFDATSGFMKWLLKKFNHVTKGLEFCQGAVEPNQAATSTFQISEALEGRLQGQRAENIFVDSDGQSVKYFLKLLNFEMETEVMRKNFKCRSLNSVLDMKITLMDCMIFVENRFTT